MAAGVTNRMWSVEELVDRNAWTGSQRQGPGGKWYKPG